MYQRIETDEVKSFMESRGFRVRSEQWARVKSAERQGLQRHVVRMYHPDINFKDRREVPEIIIQNSYDTSTSVNLMLGVYRLVCSNGLIVGSTFGGASIRHVGSVRSKVLDALDHLDGQIKGLEGFIDEAKQKTVDLSGLKESFDKLIIPKNATILNHNGYSPESAYRAEDESADIWTTFNRVQERMMKGGVPYLSESNKIRRTKRIKGLYRTIQVNKNLWNFCLEGVF